MKERSVSSIDILKFIDGEFRYAARDVLELHGLEISGRIEKFLCIEVLHRENLTFSYYDNLSKFRAGDYVLLNPNHSDLIGENIRVGGNYIVRAVDAKKKTLILEEPYYVWTNHFSPDPNQRCVIDTRPVSRFPLYTYPAWASGYLNSEKEPGPLIRRILTGKYRDERLPETIPPPSFLLKKQQKAFKHAMCHRISLIQGPPGTGKTFLIAQIAEAFTKLGLRVCICSFSHRAINNALNACVRETSLTGISKIGGDYVNDDLDKQVSGENPVVVGMTAFAAFKDSAQSIRKSLKDRKYRPPAIPLVRDEKYWRELDAYIRSIFEEGIADSGPQYDAVIFDEASQILVHHALMAMPLGKRYIFVGDHRQMPPVIQGSHRGNPVNRSVFSLLLEYYPKLNTMLDETRRMNRAISAFPSHEYYHGRLEPIPEVKERKLALTNTPPNKVLASIIDPAAPVVFVHIDHEGYTQECPEEAQVVARIVFELVYRGGIDPKEGLCVVAAHRRQNNLIRQSIAELVKKKRLIKQMAQKLLSPDLVIDTVERIQGQEREAVIVSLTASDEDHIKMDKDFLMMPNRMNVSFTRPKSKLVVVGSKKLFRVIPGDRNEQYEEDVDGRTVFRSKGITLTNHFKRWYFHVKESQKIVEATDLAT